MRLNTFKILFIIGLYPLTAHTHTLSQAEHCRAIEEKWDIESSAHHDTYVTIYLNHLQECKPSIERQFSLYKKLWDQLLRALPSPSSMKAIGKVADDILDQIPEDPNLDALYDISQEPWAQPSERIQKDENIVSHISPAVNYSFTKPLQVVQQTQELRGVSARITEMAQSFPSQFSICANTEFFQHLLRPFHYLVQDLIFLFTKIIDYNQLFVFQQLYKTYHLIHKGAKPPQRPDHPQFISWLQFPLPFIEFLQSIDWTAPPFHNNYQWLDPLLTLLTLHKNIREKMQNYCVPYQPFAAAQFTEYHIVQFLTDHNLPEEERGKILETTQEHLRERHQDFFFNSIISSNKESIYVYLLKLRPHSK